MLLTSMGFNFFKYTGIEKDNSSMRCCRNLNCMDGFVAAGVIKLAKETWIIVGTSCGEGKVNNRNLEVGKRDGGLMYMGRDRGGPIG